MAGVMPSGDILVEFEPSSVGRNGILLRTSGTVRQLCPVGLKQAWGNPVNFTVCAAGHERRSLCA
jgi:hypothetical protein